MKDFNWEHKYKLNISRNKDDTYYSFGYEILPSGQEPTKHDLFKETSSFPIPKYLEEKVAPIAEKLKCGSTILKWHDYDYSDYLCLEMCQFYPFEFSNGEFKGLGLGSFIASATLCAVYYDALEEWTPFTEENIIYAKNIRQEFRQILYNRGFEDEEDEGPTDAVWSQIKATYTNSVKREQEKFEKKEK
ncbi:MAG: hypothetical protein ABH804_01930 [archaeon]